MSADNVHFLHIPNRSFAFAPEPRRRRVDLFKVAVWSGVLVWTAGIYALAVIGLAYLTGWLA